MLDLAIQLVTRLILFGPNGFAPLFKAVKPGFAAAHLTPVDPVGGFGQSAQEGAVMADQHIGAAGRFQLGLQPFDGLDVQMVGRFVQEHQLRRLGHEFGQGRPPPLTARGGGDRRFGVELQPLGHDGHLIAFAIGQAAGRVIAQGGIARQIGVLLHISHGHTGRHNAQTRIRLDQPRHHLHQGGLARSIAPHQRNPVAGLHHKVKVVEDRIATEGQGNAGKLKKGCACHGGAAMRGCARRQPTQISLRRNLAKFFKNFGPSPPQRSPMPSAPAPVQVECAPPRLR